MTRDKMAKVSEVPPADVGVLTISDRVWLRTLKLDLLDMDKWPDEETVTAMLNPGKWDEAYGDVGSYFDPLRCRDEIVKLVALVERLGGFRL